MKASVNSLHHQESDWLREIEFYNQETDILVQRLNELTPYLEGDNKTRLAGFLSTFADIKKQCAALGKENQERYDRLNQLAKADAEHITTEFTADKDDMHKEMSKLALLFSKTRYDLNSFLVTGK